MPFMLRRVEDLEHRYLQPPHSMHEMHPKKPTKAKQPKMSNV